MLYTHACICMCSCMNAPASCCQAVDHCCSRSSWIRQVELRASLQQALRVVARGRLACDPGYRRCRSANRAWPLKCSYKRVKGRSHTVEKRKAIHPQKPHATSQPSRFSQTPRLSTDAAHNYHSYQERPIHTSHHDISTGTAKPAS